MKLWPGLPLKLIAAFPFGKQAQGQLRPAVGSSDIPAFVQRGSVWWDRDRG